MTRVPKALRATWLATALAASAASTRPAYAADPSPPAERAERALADARRDPRYTFCAAPKRPLPPDARAFCHDARAIPDCAGLVAACEGPPPSPRLLEALAALLPWLLGVGKVAIWGVLAVVVVLVLVPAVLGLRALLRRRRREAPARVASDATPDAPPAAAPLAGHERLFAEADRLLAGGELARATSTYLAAALAGLEARGLLHREPQRTNGEYVRRAPGDVRADLAALAAEVDAQEYGGAAADAARVRALGEAARRLARAVSTPALTAIAFVLAVALSGCGVPLGDLGRATGPRADDPAGPELGLDVLARLGHAPRPLPRALVHLEPPRPDGPAEVIVLDTRRVHVEDAALPRLEAFVRGGGVLLLAGDPSTFPPAFGARADWSHTFDRARLRETLPGSSPRGDDGDEDGDEVGDDGGARDGTATCDDRDATPWFDDALVQRAPALVLDDGVPVARSVDGDVAAAFRLFGEGAVLAVTGSEIFANAGILRGRNVVGVATLVSLAEQLAVGTADDGARADLALYVARPEDAFEPPSNPLAALVRAGLGLALLHAAFAVGALYVAKGARHASPVRLAPPGRTAFAEHVRATGAFYGLVRADRHALRAYARWLAHDGLTLARGAPRGRGGGEAAEALADRAGRPVAEVRAALDHAAALDPSTKLDGDERARLHELVALAAKATSTPQEPTS